MEVDRPVQAPAGLTNAEILAFALGIVVGPSFTEPESLPTSPLS